MDWTYGSSEDLTERCISGTNIAWMGVEPIIGGGGGQSSGSG